MDDSDSALWDRLWPITDRFEEFCITQDIRVPSYHRVSKTCVLSAFNAAERAALTAEQKETFDYFRSMSEEEFGRMFNELYNPFRLSERKKH